MNLDRPRLIESITAVLLSLHGALLAQSIGLRPVVWPFIGATALIGAAALLPRPGKVEWRACALVVLALGLIGLTGGASSFFLLWGFVTVAVYTALVDTVVGRLISFAVAGGYLVLAVGVGENPLPPVVLAGRVGLLLLIGLVVTEIMRWERMWAGRAGEEQRTRVELERLYSTVFDHAGDAIVVIDSERKVTLFNRSAEDLYKRSATETIGIEVSDLVPDDCHSDLDDALTGLFAGRDGMQPMRRAFRPDGTEVPTRSSAARVDLEGRTLAILVVRDDTPVAEEKQALQVLVEEKNDFVASVSHELRTPLSAVVGLAAVLSDEGRKMDEIERSELARLVHRQSTEVAHIVDDLLAAARAEAGQLTVVSNQVDLLVQARAVLDDLAKLDSDTYGEVALDGDCRRVVGDDVRIRQIIRNLVINAARHGGESVLVRISESGERGRVAVLDDGSGIPVSAEHHVFEPYRRFHQRPTQTNSIGLGLAVSQTLARLMGGDLTYRRTEDDWSEFAVSLPIA